MTSSGTYQWDMSNADVALESFDRLGIRPPALTGQHMISCKRSLNLELQSWANNGIHLWAVDLQTVNLIQGVTQYSVPQNTVSVLDVYLRTFTLTNTLNAAPNFSTVINTAAVTIYIANHGLVTGNFINLATQISVGGQILYGFYQVASVINSNQFTITAAANATSTVNSGGQLPAFTTMVFSSDLSVNLPNHGQVVNALFQVDVETYVGGITLFGSYTVLSVTDANNFVIQAYQDAGASTTVSENNGQAQVGAQTQNVDPIDRILSPMGRTDYAMMPDKFVQGTPTQYWFDRLINPQLTIWQVPDQNGPYQLQYYRMRQLQDANATMGDTPDMPSRYYDAFCARMAHRLSFKWAPDKMPMLQQEAMRAFEEAQGEDRERAPIYFRPDLSSYYE